MNEKALYAGIKAAGEKYKKTGPECIQVRSHLEICGLLLIKTKK